MSKFESFVKGVTVTVETIFLYMLVGSFELDTITALEFVLYTLSSLIVATYTYKKAHDWNNSILNRLK